MSRDSLFAGTSNAYRSEFLFAVEAARALHDPATEWALFRDVLWTHLALVFGVDVQECWPQGFPDPAAAPKGDAHNVAAWLREQG